MEDIRELEKSQKLSKSDMAKKTNFAPVFNFERDFEPIESLCAVPASLASTKSQNIVNKITGNINQERESPNYLPTNFDKIDEKLVQKFYKTVI
jgi:hypothetical protein